MLRDRPAPVIQSCQDWIDRGDLGAAELVTSALTWDEVAYIAGRGGKSRGQGEVYDRQRSMECSQLLLNMRFLVLHPVDRSAIAGANQILHKVNLRPRDALHAQLALTHAGGNLVTVDRDFTRESVLKTLGLRVTTISGP